MINASIFRLGTWKRNPSLPSYYGFLQQSDKWSLEKLENYQIANCRELLVFAYANSDYYRDVFDSCSFDPALFSCLDDLKKIPSIDKSVLMSKNKEIHTGGNFRKLFFSETSGTSGQVLKFYRNEEWESGHRAAIFRGYSWFDVNPWDRNGYFWGYNIGKKDRLRIALLDYLQNRFRVFSYQEKEIVTFAKKLTKATFLHGYSSMIYEVAKMVNRMGMGGQFNLRMIKGTSEKVYANYQDEVIKAFGTKMINEYGSAESGIIAYECPEGSLHICSENVIVEEEDEEIIVTNLLSKSFPIIRYKLGDYVKLADKDFRCKCGRVHPVILEVLGRIGKNIVGKRHNYPSLTFYYVFKNLTLSKNITLNYQATQEKKGKVVLKIEQNKGDFINDLMHELQKYFKNDIDFQIHYNQKLHTKDGKLKDFITTLS